MAKKELLPSLRLRNISELKGIDFAIKESAITLSLVFSGILCAWLFGAFVIHKEWGIAWPLISYCSLGLILAFSIATNEFNKSGFTYFLASSASLFVRTDKSDSVFLEVPWAKITHCFNDEYGLDNRGFFFAIDTESLNDEEKYMISNTSIIKKNNTLLLATSYGTNDPEWIISKLHEINPSLEVRAKKNPPT